MRTTPGDVRNAGRMVNTGNTAMDCGAFLAQS